jgi:hypothetical protein
MVRVYLRYWATRRHTAPLLQIEILKVPGYEGVRIHWGNDETANEGCLPVNKSYDMKHPE